MDPVLCTVKFIWPQHGAIFVVKCPVREGKAEVFKCCTFARKVIIINFKILCKLGSSQALACLSSQGKAPHPLSFEGNAQV